MSDKVKQLCIYCQKREAVKREHVVATCFFRANDDEPLPPMLTVPACHECDRGRGDGGPCDFHLDEEYVRNTVVAKMGMDEHPVARKLIGKAMRSIGRTPKIAVKLLKGSKPVNLLMEYPQGIVVPTQTGTINVELDRFRRVFKKIVRGLHYIHYGEPLAASEDIRVYVDLPRDNVHQAMGNLNGPWLGWNDATFQYKYGHVVDRPEHIGLWLMVFYGRFPTLAIVNPPPAVTG